MDTVQIGDATLMLGDCVQRMKEIPDASVDCVLTDPPYPGIKRKYGYWTEEAWHSLMRGVVAESRRILKPHGSAVFILQPNSERVGRMRPWLFEFQAWTAREWNMVQDAYWWNFTALPTGGATTSGLMRGSVKPCVWLGAPDCYRDQNGVLWAESDDNAIRRKADKVDPLRRVVLPSGADVNYYKHRQAAVDRGGTTPHNIIPMRGATAKQSKDSGKHPALTPEHLAEWWTRYITRPGNTILDPFSGSGTIGMAALKLGRKFLGIEKFPAYFDICKARFSEPTSTEPVKPKRAKRRPVLVEQRDLF